MGGVLPLGYDVPTDQATRALVVNPEEAKTVRLIFRRFLELGNSRALQLWLESEGSPAQCGGGKSHALERARPD